MSAERFFTWSYVAFFTIPWHGVCHIVSISYTVPLCTGMLKKTRCEAPDTGCWKLRSSLKRRIHRESQTHFRDSPVIQSGNHRAFLRQRIVPQWALKTPHLITLNRRICRSFQSFMECSAGCSLYRSNVRSFLLLWITWREFSWHVFSIVRVCMTWENTKDVSYERHLYGSMALLYNGLWCDVC